MRNKKRIKILLGKVSYLMKEENLSIMNAIYKGIPHDTPDPYHIEDDYIINNLNNVHSLKFKEYTEKCEAIYYIWKAAPDMRLTQLICNTLPRSEENSDKNILYSKHPKKFSDEKIMKLINDYYFVQ